MECHFSKDITVSLLMFIVIFLLCLGFPKVLFCFGLLCDVRGFLQISGDPVLFLYLRWGTEKLLGSCFESGQGLTHWWPSLWVIWLCHFTADSQCRHLDGLSHGLVASCLECTTCPPVLNSPWSALPHALQSMATVVHCLRRGNLQSSALKWKHY